ncbi:hypothetical protein [Mammaliicoccus sciuri]|uniref:hypothetical protein n=1 Tax=Mammaliicoccus sciuri TaxID=1296 RepID=UPI0034DD043B
MIQTLYFYNEVGEKMYTSAMLKEKPVVVQRALFDHYANLGLNEKQFVILIKLLDQRE